MRTPRYGCLFGCNLLLTFAFLLYLTPIFTNVTAQAEEPVCG